MTDALVIETASEQETEQAGEQLGRQLAPGSVVLLYGALGAGKTAFVRGMARALGAHPEDVSSPTFTIVQEYAGARATLYHVDLYRLESPEIDDLGLDDLMADGGIMAIEWADRWKDRPGRPANVIEATIDHLGEDARRITIRS